MNRSYRIIPCYSGDVSGVASALYELGGMVVIHDPSGCNSTYNTHDETRWYDEDSLIFISGLKQTDAILGNDEKFIQDILDAARELHPRFIALASSPITYMNGTDFRAIARILSRELGIPVFFVPTNGMHDYPVGAGASFVELWKAFEGEFRGRRSSIAGREEALQRSCEEGKVREDSEGKDRALAGEGSELKAGSSSGDSLGASSHRPLVNILGMTPLDFAAPGSVKALVASLRIAGFEVNCCWAMGSSLDDLFHTTEADVNLVVSSLGYPLALELERACGLPFVVGTPIGKFTKVLAAEIKKAVCGEAYERYPCLNYDSADGMIPGAYENAGVPCDCGEHHEGHEHHDHHHSHHGASAVSLNYGSHCVLIGEPVTMHSLARAIEGKHPETTCEVICPLEVSDDLIGAEPRGRRIYGEEDLEAYLEEHKDSITSIYADPLYRPICPAGIPFLPLPHEAFSGRCFRRSMPNLMELRP